MKLLGNLKIILIFAGFAAAIWFYKDWQHQRAENKRQSENMQQLRHQDSLKYARVELTNKEIKDHLNFNNQELKAKLEENNIRISRLQSIITQKNNYRDTTRVDTELKGLVESIVNNQPKAITVLDSTECWYMKGEVYFDGQKLGFNVLDRRFKNKTDVVSFVERNKWSFFGLFKTRLFGKKQINVKIFNTCGETETFIVDNKKRVQ